MFQAGVLALMLLSGGVMGNTETAADEWKPGGDFVVGERLGGPDANGPYCPPDALAVQTPVAAGGTWYYSDLEFCNPSNSSQCGRVRVESFPPLSKPFGMIRVEGANRDAAFCGCARKVDRFRIRLYAPGTQPDPNNWLYSEDDVRLLSKEFTYRSPWEFCPPDAYYYTFVLATPQPMPNGGFVSIVAMGDPKCFFLWAGSTDGDLCVWQWYESDIPGTFGKHCSATHDANYCIMERKNGACCDDRTATCFAGNEIECADLGLYFKANTACADLNPPCGEGIGACCGDAASNDCTLTTFGDCEALDSTGQRWIGRDRKCADCCTIVIGSNRENEPDTSQCDCCPGDANCDRVRNFADINPFVAALGGAVPCSFCNVDANGDGRLNFADINPFVSHIGVDCIPWPNSFNRGCAGDPNEQGYPATRPIQPDVPVWGELGTWKIGNERFRDEDWYKFRSTGNGKLVFEVQSETPVEAMIAFAGTTCDSNQPTGYNLHSFLTNDGCPAVVTLSTPCLPEQTYYLIVRPATTAPIPCGMDYKATLTVQACTPCSVTPSGYLEREPCGEDRNGGCDATPHLFELLPSSTITFCGSTWARNGRRDSDWYAVNVTRPGRQKWTVESEVPIRATPVFDFSTQQVQPPDPNCGLYWTWNWTYTTPDPSTGCNRLTSPDLTTYVYAPGQYWFQVQPDRDGGGQRVFYGYPCGILNEYKVNLVTEGMNCGDICSGSTMDDLEITNNWICHNNNWRDRDNGGCDANDFALVQNVWIDDRVCGQTGVYRYGQETRRDYDWYKLNIPSAQKVTFGLRSELPVWVEIYRGTTCGNFQIVDAFLSDKLCIPDFQNSITACLPAGDYYLRVYVNSRDPNAWPCRDPNNPSDDYRYAIDIVAEASCTQACEFTCTGGPDEACGERPDRNPGCDKDGGADPNSFMIFAKGVEYCGRIYDNAQRDPNGLDRDVDWFRFTVATQQVVTWTVKADFRLDLVIYRDCGTDPLHTVTFDRRDEYAVAVPQTATCGAIVKGTDNSGKSINLTPDTYEAVLSNLYIGGLPCSSNRVEYTIRWD